MRDGFVERKGIISCVRDSLPQLVYLPGFLVGTLLIYYLEGKYLRTRYEGIPLKPDCYNIDS